MNPYACHWCEDQHDGPFIKDDLGITVCLMTGCDCRSCQSAIMQADDKMVVRMVEAVYN